VSKADLLEAWSAHLRDGRRRSPHTVRAYLATADRLLSENGLTTWAAVAALDGLALRRQLALRRADGLVNTSAARELSALKGFIAFARSQSGVEATRPRLRGPRIKKGLPRPVTPDEAVNLAELVGSTATEDWIGEDPRPWSFPNEWLPEYTQPRKIDWQPDGDGYKGTVKLLPGELRVYCIKTAR